MMNKIQYPFILNEHSIGEASYLPLIPIQLQYQNAIQSYGLLDTGASVNVLPYRLGLELGAIWEEQTTPVVLSGNLANFEARVLLISGKVADFPSIRLAFAWTRAESVPLILGQVNFFMEFDVCFHRSQLNIEIQLKPS